MRTRVVIVLSLFSGRRRAGDIQEFFGKEPAPDGAVWAFVALDVAVDPVAGDLLDVTVAGAWLARARGGLVGGLVGGPPCETWTRARGWDDGGPRPLRSLEHSWGLPGLRPRELEQVRAGNALLAVALLLFWAVVARGGAALLEHPAEPPEVHGPSIWRPDVVGRLRRLPVVQLLTVDQGPLGAASRKPTGLLAARLPGLAGRLAALAEPGWTSGGYVAHGRGEDGRFRTAALKEYPPRLCKGVAGELAQALRGRRCQGDVSDAEDGVGEAALGAVAAPPAGDAAMGDDFAGKPLPFGAIRWDRLAGRAPAGA